MGKASNRKKDVGTARVLPRDPKPLEGQNAARAADIVQVALRGGTTVDKICRAVAELDFLAEQNAASASAFAEVRRLRGETVRALACRAGCAYCCFVRVSAMPIEIVAISEFVRKRFTSEQREALRERVDRHNAETERMDASERARSIRPCPFLVENRCTIYEVRPLACRAHHSVDLPSCERAFRGEGDGAIPILRDHHSAVIPLIRGAYAGLARAGSRQQDLEFVPAIGVALSEPEAPARWCAGEDAFAAAVDSEQAQARAETRPPRTLASTQTEG